jgi:hypothetical protein
MWWPGVVIGKAVVWCAAGIKLKSHAANLIERRDDRVGFQRHRMGRHLSDYCFTSLLSLSFLIFTSGLKSPTAFYFHSGVLQVTMIMSYSYRFAADLNSTKQDNHAERCKLLSFPLGKLK